MEPTYGTSSFLVVLLVVLFTGVVSITGTRRTISNLTIVVVWQLLFFILFVVVQHGLPFDQIASAHFVAESAKTGGVGGCGGSCTNSNGVHGTRGEKETDENENGNEGKERERAKAGEKKKLKLERTKERKEGKRAFTAHVTCAEQCRV